MLHALTDYRSDVVVGERIKHRLTRAARAHELVPFQNRQLMRHGGVRHRQRGGEVAHAHLRFKQNEQYANARRVAEYFEQLREVVERVLVGQLFVDDAQEVVVYLRRLAALVFVVVVHL